MIEGLANLDAVCSATASRTEGGWRALDLRAWDGIDARLLPDRGLDCFGAWYRGVPLAWVSAVGERGPLGGRLRDDDWLRGFGGGLVATCGLRNVGAAERGPRPARRDLPPARARRARGALGRRRAGDRQRLGHGERGQRARPSPRARADLDDADGRGPPGARRRDAQPRARARGRPAALPRQPRGAAVVARRDARAAGARDDAARRRRRRAVGPRAGAPRGRARARLRARGRRRRGRLVRCGGRLAGHRAAAAAALGGRRRCRAFTSGCTPRRGSPCSAWSRRTARSSAAPPTARRGACPCSSPARSASRAWRSASRRGVDGRRGVRQSGKWHVSLSTLERLRVSLDDPVIITCSISGALANRDQCPAIPYTPEEYAAEARRIVDEGGGDDPHPRAPARRHAELRGRGLPRDHRGDPRRGRRRRDHQLLDRRDRRAGREADRLPARAAGPTSPR